MKSLVEQLAKNQKTNYGGSNYTRDNIWFDWGNSDEHTIRLVGEVVTLESHWIGESTFQKGVTLLNSKAFVGDDRIPKQVACGNWDPETDTSTNGECPVCHLMENAHKMLTSPKLSGELSAEDKEIIKGIRAKCRPQRSYMFKILDRDNPYVDEQKTRKGYKILKITNDLATLIGELAKNFEKRGIMINSPQDGIDIVIKRIKKIGKPGYTYSVTQAMNGLSVKQTPLTEEELGYRDLNLLLFAGKPISKERFEQELVDTNNVRTIYEWNGEVDDAAEASALPVDHEPPF